MNGVVTEAPPDTAGPVRELLGRVSNKWVVQIIELLARSPGELRFSQLLRSARGVSSKMLSATLRDLVRDGFVERRSEHRMGRATGARNDGRQQDA